MSQGLIAENNSSCVALVCRVPIMVMKLLDNYIDDLCTHLLVLRLQLRALDLSKYYLKAVYACQIHRSSDAHS